ncbi:MAG: hypothetical protein ABI641_11340 [Caldimonas sp.]
MNLVDGFGRVLRALLLGLFALIVAIEEWGWRPLAALAGRLSRWPPLGRLEARIAASSPRVALVLFLVPATAFFPLKIVALWLIDDGRVALGVGLILAAKVIGTALVGRLFMLLEPKLVQFARFARALAWWRRTKARVHAALRGSAAWRRVRLLRLMSRRWLRRMSS